MNGIGRFATMMLTALALVQVLPVAPLTARAEPARCLELPPCTGCGCRGGPGYRSKASGKCVGYKALSKTCGDPQTLRCSFENAPGSGLNRDCVLGTLPDQPD